MKITNMEAVQAQAALAKLMDMDIPILVSLDIALISNIVDEQVKAFSKVRDNIYKKYAIKTEKGETEGSIQFTSTLKGETEEETINIQNEALNAFGEKFNELLAANTEELNFKLIKLPKEIDGKPLQIKPSILKSLTKFIEVS